jgi:GNAT superfamily N-acetyltransferase
MSTEISCADFSLALRLESTDARVGVESARIHAQLHPESGATAEPCAGGYAIFIAVDSPLTQALGIGMQGPVTAGEVEQLEAFFAAHATSTRIELCPLADPSLRRVLAERGYALRDHSNMLFRRIRPGTLLTVPKTTIEIQRCKPGDAKLWARTVAEGFAEDFANTEENIRVLMMLFQKAYATCVLARVDGRPAGGGALSAIEGVSALYGASTLPQYRRRGVQSAIIHSLLDCAVEAGCDLVYTLTQPASSSQRNVERQGFHVAYTRSLMVKEFPPM